MGTSSPAASAGDYEAAPDTRAPPNTATGTIHSGISCPGRSAGAYRHGQRTSAGDRHERLDVPALAASTTSKSEGRVGSAASATPALYLDDDLTDSARNRVRSRHREGRGPRAGRTLWAGCTCCSRCSRCTGCTLWASRSRRTDEAGACRRPSCRSPRPIEDLVCCVEVEVSRGARRAGRDRSAAQDRVT